MFDVSYEILDTGYLIIVKLPEILQSTIILDYHAISTSARCLKMPGVSVGLFR